MKKIVTSLTALALLALPAAAMAQVTIQGSMNTTYVDQWISKILSWSQQGVTFLMIAATLWFIWSVIVFIRSKDAKDSEEKKGAMLRGIIGLFVIVAIWGIIRIITSTLGVGTGSLDSSNIPCPPGMTYNSAIKSCN